MDVKYLNDVSFSLTAEFHLDDPYVQPGVHDWIVQIILDLDEEEGTSSRGTVLVFAPGMREIRYIINAMASAAKNGNWEVLALHSSIGTPEQQQIFIHPHERRRRIIVSTNIAESSITVPDVRLVIDTCLTKQLQRDAASSFTCLQLAWASKSNCDQRKGRTGRVQSGTVYRLVTREFYQRMPRQRLCASRCIRQF